VTTSLSVVNQFHVLIRAIVLLDITTRVALHHGFSLLILDTLTLLAGSLLNLGSHRVLGSVVLASVARFWKSYAQVLVEFFISTSWTSAHRTHEWVKFRGYPYRHWGEYRVVILDLIASHIVYT